MCEHAVSFTKGCYTGQELVARLDARGGNVARRLRGVVLEPGGEGRDRCDELVVGGREVGRLTSVAWSPGFRSQVALAYVRRDVTPPAQSRWRRNSGPRSGNFRSISGRQRLVLAIPLAVLRCAVQRDHHDLRTARGRDGTGQAKAAD